MRSAITSISSRDSFFVGLAAILLAALAPACAGKAGADGADGVNGANGNDGADGQPGDPGTKGDPGDSVYVDQSLTPIQKAFVGIGGQDLVMGMTSMRVSSAGALWLPGEGFRPEDPAPKVTSFDIDLTADLATDSMRIDHSRHIDFLGFALDQTFSEITVGDVGVVDGVESLFGIPTGDMTPDRWGTTRKHQRLLHPVLILRDIAADPTLVIDEKGVALLDGSVHHLVVVSDPVSPITLWVSVATGWIDKVSLVESEPVIGDVEVEAFYYGWGTFGAGGIRFPSDVYIAHDERIVHQENRTMIGVNEAINADTFTFPAGSSPVFDADRARRGEALNESMQIELGAGLTIYDAQQTFVNDTVLAPGVHYLGGGSHNSLLVEQANGLVLIEAPLEQARSEAILSWAQATFPSMPITHVVSTHHHTDHAGGVRTIGAAGATSVVSAVSADFFKFALSNSATVYPDALALNPVNVPVMAVPEGGTLTLPDATNPVTLFHIQTGHAADMIMAYLPSAQVVFESDLLNPASPLQILPAFLPNAVDLHAAIIEAGIASPTLQIAGGHGAGTNTFAELEAALP